MILKLHVGSATDYRTKSCGATTNCSWGLDVYKLGGQNMVFFVNKMHVEMLYLTGWMCLRVSRMV